MGKHGNRHFDKKNAQKFRLVPGGKLIFPSEGAHDSNAELQLDDETRKAEQVKYGVFYDDDYDYLQHLRSSSEPARLELVKQKAGPVDFGLTEEALRPVHLPEVMDEAESISDDDIDEVDRRLEVEDVEMNDSDGLDDDFIIQANCGQLPTLNDHGLIVQNNASNKAHPDFDDDWFDSDDSEDDVGSDDMDRYFAEKMNIHEKPTDNQQRSLLDERFAKVLEGYDDDDIGALDDTAIRGGSLQPNDDLFRQAEEDFEKRRRVNKKPTPGTEKVLPVQSASLTIKERTVEESETSEESVEEDSEDEEFEKIKVPVKPKPTQLFNCESILSITSSCIPSHCPRLIVEKSDKPRRNSGSKNVSSKLAVEDVQECSEPESDDDNSVSQNNASITRKRNETTEERKARKAELRERKKERREQKKTIKAVFGREKTAVERQLNNTMAAVRLA